MKDKKSILIIGHGGTISMIPGDYGLTPAKSAEDLVAQAPLIKETANVDFLQLENIDSVNANPTHWIRLAIEIKKELNKDKYDGIIVTHGTDTMTYASSAVAISLGRGLKRPVVFTGSQLPLVDFGTDAKFNLENAVKTVSAARDNGIAEVMITFADKVLRASRAVKVSESKFPAFDSPAIDPLADITAFGVEFGRHALKVDEHALPELVTGFNNEVLTIEVVPGLRPEYLQHLIRNTKLSGILLKSLGAGNVPTKGEYSLIPTIEEAVKRNIPVVISTKFVGGRTNMEVYETGVKPIKAGAIPVGDMTDVMAQVKMMWILANQDPKNPMKGFREKLQKNYVGEITT